MIAPTGPLILLGLVIVYFIVYKFFLSKMSLKNFSLLGFALSIIPLVYFILLAALGQSMVPCSLVSSSLAGMEPIFLRDLIGSLIGVSPLLGLFSGIAMIKKNKASAFAIIVLSVISLAAVSFFSICIQF